jgi:hypothetical protein
MTSLRPARGGATGLAGCCLPCLSDRTGIRRETSVAGKWLIGLCIVLLVTGPVRAECLGACASDLAAAFFSLVVYGLIGIVLLIMLIRAKWRRKGLWGLGIVAVLALGVPLISQAWLSWKLRGVEAREIVGEPPVLAAWTPLLITPDDYCSDNACEAVLRGRGAAGAYVILTRALDGMDLSQAVPLADLPLEVWSPLTASGELPRRTLTPAERQEAAGRIDYLIVTTWPYYPADPGPIEAALRLNPEVSGMGPGEAVRLLLAPMDPGLGTLTLSAVRPDVLDLNLLDKALAIPLAPRNYQRAENRSIGVDAAARAVCPAIDPSGNCGLLLER